MFEFLRLQPRRPDRALHGYVYYRWTNAYVRLVRYFLDRDGLLPGFRGWAGRRLARSHHAKVVPVEQARRVVSIDRPVEIHNPEQVVPYPLARDVVLASPPKIALAECACRKAADQDARDESGCGPVDVCLYMGEPIASFLVEKRPDTARLVTVEEALAVVEAAAERGNVHTLWFKDAAAGRMYALCNCCGCCCTGFQGQREGFGPLAPSGFVAVADAGACDGCGVCVEACHFGALRLEEDVGSGDITAVVDAAACFGCGTCALRCSRGALSLQSLTEGVRPLQL